MSMQIFYIKLVSNNQHINDKLDGLIHDFSLYLNTQHHQPEHNTQLGKILLIETIKAILPDFDKNELFYVNGKPQCKRAWLSLSYSQNIIIAAASTIHKIGIDIEYIAPIEINQYINELSKEEKAFLYQTNNKLYWFYYIWTRKEAILKACGLGLQYPLSDLNTLQANISLITSPIRWYINSLIIYEEYMFSFACESAIMFPQPIELNSLMNM